MSNRVAVPGASGHTGRFVIAELRRRGLTPIPCPRGTDLDQAFRGADAVINCAGPFAETAKPVTDAAIRAGIPYLDVTAEPEVVRDAFTRYADAPIPVVPAAAFYGGLADLLATACGLPTMDHLTIAYALSSWHPTPGTRATGRVSARRRGNQRLAYAGGALILRTGEPPHTTWRFPSPLGVRPVATEFTTADSVTVPSHLNTPEITSLMTVNAVADLRSPDLPAPAPTDDSGRSDQTFLVEVTASATGTRRTMVARGRDIYAVTAPLAVEATERILAGEGAHPGVASLGARFDSRDFLNSLTPGHMTLD